MTAINLVFINKKSLRAHTIPVSHKSEAQSLIDMLDKKKVDKIRISYLWNNEEHVAYVTHEKTHQLIKV